MLSWEFLDEGRQLMVDYMWVLIRRMGGVGHMNDIQFKIEAVGGFCNLGGGALAAENEKIGTTTIHLPEIFEGVDCCAST